MVQFVAKLTTERSEEAALNESRRCGIDSWLALVLLAVKAQREG